MNLDIRDLMDRLPSREDLMRAVQRNDPFHHRNDHQLAELLGVFGAGLVVGTALALLYAPRAGRELRAELKGQAARLTEEARETVGERLGQRIDVATGAMS